MIVRISQKNQSLNDVVLEHYGNLNHLDEVIDLNPKLLHKIVLELGDVVELPEFKNDSKKEDEIKSVW